MTIGSLRGYFLSDLHLFARRSKAGEIAPLIHEAASQAHTLVLGGDIFDFKWSTHSSLDESITAAIDWLDELVSLYPRCSFHYVLGNHDSHPKFVAELDRLAFRQPRLQWQSFVLQILDCVFLHGDIVDCAPDHTILAERRRLFEFDQPKKELSHWLYDVVVKTKIHRLAMHMAIHQKTVLRRLATYLTEEGLDSEHGVKDVYFGHTHRLIDDVEFAGLRFHNGGASIRGLPFRIIETRLPYS